MEANYKPLRYNISNWSQLSLCKSNTNKELQIEVTKFINNENLEGARIVVKHPRFGVLYAVVVNPSGNMVVDSSNGEYLPQVTVGQILNELARFGFIVEYNPVEALSGEQIQFLMTIRDLLYDKIRILPVRYKTTYTITTGVTKTKLHVVAFKVSEHPYWLNADYSATEAEYLKGLEDGSVFNVTNVTGSDTFSWNWLEGWVGDINDIVRDSSYLTP